MSKKRLPFTPKGVFHVFNHANGRENIFEEPENYHFFLKKYARFLHGVVEIYVYCLLPNHFHLLVRVRSEAELLAFYKKKKGLLKVKAAAVDFHKIVQRQFTSF